MNVGRPRGSILSSNEKLFREIFDPQLPKKLFQQKKKFYEVYTDICTSVVKLSNNFYVDVLNYI